MSTVKLAAIDQLRKDIDDRSMDLSEEVSKLIVKQRADDLVAERSAILVKALAKEEVLSNEAKKAAVGSKRFTGTKRKEEVIYSEEQMGKLNAAEKKLNNFRAAVNLAINKCTDKNYQQLQKLL